MIEPMPAVDYIATWFPGEVVEVDEGSIARTTVDGWDGVDDALSARVTVGGSVRFVVVSDHTTSSMHVTDWDSLPEVEEMTHRISLEEKRKADTWKALLALAERVDEPKGWNGWDLLPRIAAKIDYPLLLNEDMDEAVARMNQILDEWEAIAGA